MDTLQESVIKIDEVRSLLVEAGYDPQAAYLECVHQLRLTAELLERHGMEGMRRRISPTALYGDLSRGERVVGPEVRDRMREILGEIRSGAFAREWLEKIASDPEWPEADLARQRSDDLEEAGEAVRRLYADPDAPERQRRNERLGNIAEA